MNIIFTRHCETDWNAVKRLQGQTDIPLNDRGRLQARELAETIARLNPSRIISSDLKRASETAVILAGHLHVDVTSIIFDRRLRECSFGSLEGKTREEAIALCGWKTWDDQFNTYDFRAFGGECRDDVARRHREACEEYTRTFRANPAILFVGHGRGLNTLLADIGCPPRLEKGSFYVYSL